MRKMKLLGVVASVIAIGTIGFIGCGTTEVEKKVEQDVEVKKEEGAIYLVTNKDDDGLDKKLSVLDDGKLIDIGESRTRTPMYAEFTDEFISFDTVNDADFSKNVGDGLKESTARALELENEIVATNKNGEKRVLLKTKVESDFGIIDGKNLYFSETGQDIKILNIKSGEVTNIPVEVKTEAFRVIDANDNYLVVQIDEEVKSYNLKDKVWETIASGRAYGLGKLFHIDREAFRKNTFSMISKNNECVYFNMSNGEITKDKIDSKGSLIIGTDDTIIYQDISSVLGELGSRDIYRKEIGKKEVLLIKGAANTVIYGDYIYGMVTDGENTKIVRVNMFDKKPKTEVIYDGDGIFSPFNLKASGEGRIVFEVSNEGVYEFKDGKLELLIGAEGKTTNVFEFVDEKLIRITLESNELGKAMKYDIYIDNEKVEEDVSFASLANGEVLYKGKDGYMYNLVNGEKQKLDIDISEYDSIFNMGHNELVNENIPSGWSIDYNKFTIN
ncbi:MAG: hypothetical protein ACRCWG_17235 [Sarcina sp.]